MLPLGLEVPDQFLGDRGARDLSQRRRQALIHPGEFLQVREPPTDYTSWHGDRRVEAFWRAAQHASQASEISGAGVTQHAAVPARLQLATDNRLERIRRIAVEWSTCPRSRSCQSPIARRRLNCWGDSALNVLSYRRVPQRLRLQQVVRDDH